MSWLSKATGVHISPEGFRLGGSPILNKITGGIIPADYDTTFFNASAKKNKDGTASNPFSDLFGILGGGMLAKYFDKGADSRAQKLSDQQDQLFAAQLAQILKNQATMNPLKEGASDTLQNKLADGSNSVLSPEGMARQALPEYKPFARTPNPLALHGGTSKLKRPTVATGTNPLG